jgi:hypothetical protein
MFERAVHVTDYMPAALRADRALDLCPAGRLTHPGDLVSCPAAEHEDRNPSCSVGTSPDQGWCCHSGNCGARGAIYDLASVLLGGPWGHELRGEAFNRARAYVADVFGKQDETNDGTVRRRPGERRSKA